MTNIHQHLNSIQDMLLQFTVERELLESKLNVMETDTDWELLDEVERIDGMIIELKRVYHNTEANGFLSGLDYLSIQQGD